MKGIELNRAAAYGPIIQLYYNNVYYKCREEEKSRIYPVIQGYRNMIQNLISPLVELMSRNTWMFI